MNRKEAQKICLEEVNKHKCLLLNLPTGFGKTLLAINSANKVCENMINLYGEGANILLVVAKSIHKKNWKDEISKWGGLKSKHLTVECYNSLHKYKDKVFDIVILDECFRGDTEILTDKGYKRFDTLTENDLVAQWYDNGEIEFVKPLRLIKRKHEGEICKVHLKKDRYVYMTPNHNQVYRTKNNKTWRVRPIKDMKFNYLNEIPTSGYGTGYDLILKPLEQLYIAIQADGSLQRHQKNESVYSIQLTKERKIKRMESILSYFSKLEYSEIKGRENTKRWMVKLPKGDAKLLSTHFDINMGYHRANSFIDEILEWDGSHCEGNVIYYSSKIKENSDFVAAVAVQAGYEVFQSVEKDDRKDEYSDIHRVFMKKREYRDTQCMTRENIPYNDYVYCVEVPTHKIVVRSEGVTFITGNCHHLSELRRDILSSITINEVIIGLSATIPFELKEWFTHKYDTYTISNSLQIAINDGVLPEPKIYLIPLTFDTSISEVINKNIKKGRKVTECSWENRWKYIKAKTPAKIHCTKAQYYQDLESQIHFFKRKAMFNEACKNKWLRLCNDRLKWLSEKKESYIKTLLDYFDKERTLTFCSSIEQTERLGKNCIHSKNKKNQKIYNDFNSFKINHITSCQMLNEGMNLVDCKIGIYANLNSSETIVEQRLGRLLRHKEPIIIIPYYKNTREEELVNMMIQGYDSKLITKIKSIDEIHY